jgi:hypothetical protein
VANAVRQAISRHVIRRMKSATTNHFFKIVDTDETKYRDLAETFVIQYIRSPLSGKFLT